ncbi:extracellular dihydrogeodin oxidase/laccase-like protein [Clohesyomyces aquaticus]|uniref:Extracellular dihydrogeodin oxidase/laccase-like protein n=1 Tax=Clohesyomyces aquaticus TaxID=1231657 RepID=A0A1Y1Z5G4_9PLEO|nr:extracellular dihydrogeodin oxidase/laccase-like protein [Clohesyomyces aquaticus]
MNPSFMICIVLLQTGFALLPRPGRDETLALDPQPHLLRRHCLNGDCTPGRPRVYNLTISRGFSAPDGVNSSMILVNGAFPGPTLEANIGDKFIIHVNNQISDPEGTALHWHGFYQKDTPWMDGVPSVTMCPIAPGHSFTYEFKADRVGISWWHSHYSAQTAGGLFGAMIVHGPLPYDFDIDIGPILLSDHFHFDFRDMVSGTLRGQIVYSSNNLINGKMRFNCSTIPPTGPSCSPTAGISKFRFQSGKIHLLRLINAAAEALQHFSIDGHNLTVVALDYVPVKAYQTTVITLSPGQRADILVSANHWSNSSFWMRSDVDPTCSGSNQPHALAAVYYEAANTYKDPTTTAIKYTTGDCVAQPLWRTEPLIPKSISSRAPDYIQVLNNTLEPNATGTLQFMTNGKQFRANYSQSLLVMANRNQNQSAAPAVQWDPLSNVYDFGENKTIRLVLYNYFVSPHPMHLHGHDFFIIGEGRGSWDGKVQGRNITNPMRRDTHQMIGAAPDGTPSYLVLQMELDNPGVWAFHCHISQHLVLGMYLNIVYQEKRIRQLKIPVKIGESCEVWRNFTNRTTFQQPDSGL